jgi:hypothetical protein
VSERKGLLHVLLRVEKHLCRPPERELRVSMSESWEVSHGGGGMWKSGRLTRGLVVWERWQSRGLQVEKRRTSLIRQRSCLHWGSCVCK